MKAGAFNKTGWHWTRKGWKRTPKHLQGVKKIAKPTKRRPFKKIPVQPAERDQLPTFAEARKLAAEKGRAESAPTPAPEADKPASAPPRRAWGGKYSDLTPPTDDEP
jgi:hypothetical protein